MSKINIQNVKSIFFDFDGVLTDNCVYVSNEGNETVRCTRSDGLAFDAMKKIGIWCCILSTETNKVVVERGNKLKIPVYYGVTDKAATIIQIAQSNAIDLSSSAYVGNDLNDYHAMKKCKFGICPSDSHHAIKMISDVVLVSKGGEGVVRELIENVVGVDLLSVLYK